MNLESVWEVWLECKVEEFCHELVGESAGRGNEGVGGGRESEVLGSFRGFGEWHTSGTCRPSNHCCSNGVVTLGSRFRRRNCPHLQVSNLHSTYISQIDNVLPYLYRESNCDTFSVSWRFRSELWSNFDLQWTSPNVICLPLIDSVWCGHLNNKSARYSSTGDVCYEMCWCVSVQLSTLACQWSEMQLMHMPPLTLQAYESLSCVTENFKNLSL